MAPGAGKVRKAVFPVGGLGTRFLPATKAVPKEMLPIVDKPLVHYAVDEARAAGIEEFIFVTGRGKAVIEDHFDISYELRDQLLSRGKDGQVGSIHEWLPDPGQVSYTRQQTPHGLGHAVWCARYLVGDEPFAVLLADDLMVCDPPCLRQMVDVHARVGGNLVAVEDVPHAHTDRYGILDVESVEGDLVRVRGIVEKPAPSRAPSTLGVIGRYLLTPDVFRVLSRMEAGAGGEVQLTDALAARIGHEPFHGLRAQGSRYDCGDKVGFVVANAALALRRDDLRDRVAPQLAALTGGG